MINLSLNQPPSQRLGFINFDINAVMNTHRGEALLTAAVRLAREFQTPEKGPSADLLTSICWANLT